MSALRVSKSASGNFRPAVVGSVLAQGGAAELNLSAQIFIGQIDRKLVVLLRTSDHRKLAFYAAIALKATELVVVMPIDNKRPCAPNS